MTTIVVSPHLDDGVLSYGGRMTGYPDVTLVTVLAGVPPEWSWPSPFDNACGFTASHLAVEARRAEDIAACAVLGARAVHLGYLDGQYGIRQEPRGIALHLLQLFNHAEKIVVPLGLLHPDHKLVAQCCRVAMSWVTGRSLTIYADQPTATMHPDLIDDAVAMWERAGWSLTPTVWACGLDRKQEAWACYASQQRLTELSWENVQEEFGWSAMFVG